MEQIIREISKEMVKRLENQRKWVKGHLPEENTSIYDNFNEKLELLQEIINRKFYEKNQTWELQSLGIVLGDALAQKLHLEWVEVEDDYGINPALRHKKSSILLFPLTMISKRIEKDEDINIKELFEGICNKVNELLLDTGIK